MKKYTLFSIAALTLIACFVQQCRTNAITGRKQLNLIPASQLRSSSFTAYQQTLQESTLSRDSKDVAMIKRVGNKISAAVESYYKEKGLSDRLDGFEWEFNLIESDQENAWCMPGGKVAFYTGILPICSSETGVAVVMGHEVAHAVANHGGERATGSLVSQVGLAGLGAWVNANPNEFSNILLQASGVGTQLGLLKFSRKHESESDEMGLIFMAMAGYDPSEAPKFWERMKAASGGQAPPEFMSTHPSSDRRISDLNGWMPKAMEYYKK